MLRSAAEHRGRNGKPLPAGLASGGLHWRGYRLGLVLFGLPAGRGEALSAAVAEEIGEGGH